MQRRGFSILEAVVALGLIVMAALILVQVFPSSRKGLQLSESHVHASYAARSLLDEARRAGFDSVAPRGGDFTQQGIIDGAATTQAFLYSVDVANLDGERKLVWATVTWREATGSKKVVLETLLTKR